MEQTKDGHKKKSYFQNIFYTSLQNYRINQNIQKGMRFVKNLRQRYRYISFIEWPSTSIVMLTSIGEIVNKLVHDKIEFIVRKSVYAGA